MASFRKYKLLFAKTLPYWVGTLIRDGVLEEPFFGTNISFCASCKIIFPEIEYCWEILYYTHVFVKSKLCFSSAQLRPTVILFLHNAQMLNLKLLGHNMPLSGNIPNADLPNIPGCWLRPTAFRKYISKVVNHIYIWKFTCFEAILNSLLNIHYYHFSEYI